ncbi:hypothetical protein ACJX0J_034206, partial [Zea mays]
YYYAETSLCAGLLVQYCCGTLLPLIWMLPFLITGIALVQNTFLFMIISLISLLETTATCFVWNALAKHTAVKLHVITDPMHFNLEKGKELN